MRKSAIGAESSASVDKSVDNFSLAAERRRAEVKGYELAEKLGIDGGDLSRFETGKAKLPNGMGPRSYRRAIQAVLEDRGDDAA